MRGGLEGGEEVRRPGGGGAAREEEDVALELGGALLRTFVSVEV
jgi:hypothetical protein